MKRILIIGTAIAIILAVWIFVRFVIGGPEDDWICENGQWIKHGAPSASMPSSPCAE